MIDYLQSQDVIFWLLVLLIPVLLVITLRERAVAKAHRRRSERALEQRHERDAAVKWLVETYLRQVDNPNESPGPFSLPNDALAGTEFEATLSVVAQRYQGCTDDARERSDAAVRNALQAVTSGFLSRVLSQQRSIESMERRFDNPQVLEALMEINHQNAGLGNWARTIAVICGGTVGRQRDPATLTDVARAAAGETNDYKRVQVRSPLDVHVLAHAVNPVVLAVAALVDNAARYSRPEHDIEVNLRTVPNGALVVIDDYGIGMGEAERRNAAELLAGTEQIEIASLGSTPQFGFRVVGLLAHRFGFTVSVDHSPYGGVRAVILLPHNLLSSQPTPAPQPTAGSAPAPVPQPRAAERATAPPPPAPGQNGMRSMPRQAPDGFPPPDLPTAPAPAARAEQHNPPPAPGPEHHHPQPPLPPAHAEPHSPTPAAAGSEQHRLQPPFHLDRQDYELGAPEPYGADAGAPGDDVPQQPEEPHVVGHTSGGLPKRSRRSPGGAPAAPAPAPEPSLRDRSPSHVAGINGALQQGTRRGRENAPRD